MTPLEAEHALTDLCAAFGVSRAGYHAWKPRPPGARQQTDQTLSLTLCQAHAASRQTYGSPRLLAALRQQGHRTSRRRVRRLMHQHALRTAIPRRFVPQTTASRHAQPIAPNRLAQTPAPTGPNQVWVGDITYVRTDEGWLYVAAVLDRWSRRGVGLAMAEHMESSLVGQALGHALHQRRPAAGCVPHTGRGSQYASGPIGSK